MRERCSRSDGLDGPIELNLRVSSLLMLGECGMYRKENLIQNVISFAEMFQLENNTLISML